MSVLSLPGSRPDFSFLRVQMQAADDAEALTVNKMKC